MHPTQEAWIVPKVMRYARPVRGRNPNHLRQRQESRQRILDAARRTAVETNSAMVTIGSIIQDAKVSRTTFFHYFDSRAAVFAELHQKFLKQICDCFDRSIELIRVAEGGPKQFIGVLLDVYQQERDLIQAFSIMEAVQPAFRQSRIQALIEISERIQSTLFRPQNGAVAESADALQRIIEIKLLLQALELLVTEILSHDEPGSREIAIDILSGRLSAIVAG